MALAEVRGGVPSRLRLGAGGANRYRELVSLLQLPAAASESGVSNARRSVWGASMKLAAKAGNGSPGKTRPAVFALIRPKPRLGSFTKVISERVRRIRSGPRRPLQGAAMAEDRSLRSQPRRVGFGQSAPGANPVRPLVRYHKPGGLRPPRPAPLEPNLLNTKNGLDKGVQLHHRYRSFPPRDEGTTTRPGTFSFNLRAGGTEGFVG